MANKYHSEIRAHISKAAGVLKTAIDMSAKQRVNDHEASTELYNEINKAIENLSGASYLAARTGLAAEKEKAKAK